MVHRWLTRICPTQVYGSEDFLISRDVPETSFEYNFRGDQQGHHYGKPIGFTNWKIINVNYYAAHFLMENEFPNTQMKTIDVFLLKKQTEMYLSCTTLYRKRGMTYMIVKAHLFSHFSTRLMQFDNLYYWTENFKKLLVPHRHSLCRGSITLIQ